MRPLNQTVVLSAPPPPSLFIALAVNLWKYNNIFNLISFSISLQVSPWKSIRMRGVKNRSTFLIIENFTTF